MPTAKPATKKPVKKKAAPKKEVALEAVPTPSEEAVENHPAEEVVGEVNPADNAPAEEVVSEEADVQIVTIVSLSLREGGNVQFDYPEYIPTAKDAYDNLEEIIPRQVYIPHKEEISLIKVDHLTAEQFEQQLAEQNATQAG